MAPTLAPDGSVIDDGTGAAPSRFVGPPEYLGPLADLGPNLKQPGAIPKTATQAAQAAPSVEAPNPTYAAGPAPAATQVPSVASSSIVPNALPFGRFSLTNRAAYSQPTSDPLSGQSTRPGYWETSNDPNTGMPSITNPGLTKLGKVLTLLRGAGMGFMAGAGQPNMSRGFVAGNQFFNQEAQQNQEVAQRAQAMEQARQAQYVQMHGVHQWIYTRDPDTGELMQQGRDIMGRPVTEQMPYAPKNPNRTPISIYDPADQAGIASGTPTMPLKTAMEDKALGGIFDQDTGQRIPNATKFESAVFNKATPAAGSEAQQALAQAGAKPAANSRVYNGKTYSTPQDATGAWGHAMQIARIPGVPITAEMAEQYNIPADFIGYKLKPTDFAALQRASVFEEVPIQTGDGEVMVNRRTATARLVKDAQGRATTPVAWAAPREVQDPDNPALTRFVTSGQAIRGGYQGLGSAGFQVPREIAEREVPTKGGDLRMAFGTMIDHANLLRQAAAALNYYGPDSQQLRGLENRFRNEFGGSGPITAQAIADAYGGEVSNVINKGHITDKGNEKVAHALDPTRQNYDTINSVLTAYQNLAQSKMNQLDRAEQGAAQRVQRRPTPQGAPKPTKTYGGYTYQQQPDGSWARQGKAQ